MEISVKNGEYHAQGSGESHSFGKKRNEHLPGLSARLYLRPIPRDREIFPVFREKCEAAGIEWRTNQIFEYLNTFEEKGCGQQLTLADFM